MVNIHKIKIKKTSYSFEINKTYEYKKKYTFVKRGLLQSFLGNFHNKSKKNKESDKKRTNVSIKKSRNPIVIGALIGLGLLLLIGALLFFSISNMPKEQNNQAPINYVMNLNILDTGILTYGEKKDKLHLAKIIVKQLIDGYDNISINFVTYTEEPPYQLYILDYPRDESQTTTYDEFKSSLEKRLNDHDLHMNSVSSEQLKTIPRGSLLIVPSGRIPKKMIVGKEDNLKQILHRGVHILTLVRNLQILSMKTEKSN